MCVSSKYSTLGCYVLLSASKYCNSKLTRLPPNGAGAANGQHVKDSECDADEDERQHDALEGANEKVTQQSKPFDDFIFSVAIILPGRETHAGADTEYSKDKEREERVASKDAAASGRHGCLLVVLVVFVLLGGVGGGHLAA
jgi:hypothetical protein